jgi:UDP-N-acetylmuramate--alanine ligase
VILAPVYAAGEDPMDGIDSAHLVMSMKAGGHRDARLVEGPEALAPIIADIAKPGDYVVLLGAGTITQWANQLPKELNALKPDAGGSA